MAGMMVATGAAGTIGDGDGRGGRNGRRGSTVRVQWHHQPGPVAAAPAERPGVRRSTRSRDLMATTKAYSATFPAKADRGVGSQQQRRQPADRQSSWRRATRRRRRGKWPRPRVMNLGALAPACNATTMGAATCAKSFIQAFGKKGVPPAAGGRRSDALPGDLARPADTGATYNERDLSGHRGDASVAFVPLPRRGIGTPTAANPAVAALTPFELASRMSYFLWQSKPDDTLIAGGRGGQARHERGHRDPGEPNAPDAERQLAPDGDAVPPRVAVPDGRPPRGASRSRCFPIGRTRSEPTSSPRLTRS